MKTYEAIQKMSAEEMAAVFYMFLKPMMDNFGLGDQSKEEMRKSIREMLNSEVAK